MDSDEEVAVVAACAAAAAAVVTSCTLWFQQVQAAVLAHEDIDGDMPAPQDDGACSHLKWSRVPPLRLPISSDPLKQIDLSSMPGLTIVFCYPRSTAVGELIPLEWDEIPGARGCIAQAHAFNSNLSELGECGVTNVFGLSTQSSENQRELQASLSLDFELLSDEHLHFQRALRLPTFEWQGKTLIKRVTVAIENGVIRKVWYPAFPPEENVHDVIDWLERASHSFASA